MKFILPKTNDPRFGCLATLLREKGFEISDFTPPFSREKSVFIFPLPLNEAECLSLLGDVPPNSTVFIGKGSENVKKAAREKNIYLTCLLEDESYLLQNAVHTAEGVLAQIIERTDRRLDQLCFLVYGYGNCGSAIARLLWLCGCEIWVCSRSRGMARAHKDGFNLYPAPQKGLGMFDGVINTVPDPIFTPEFLSTMQRDSFFFQVASGFSGIHKETVQEAGVRFVPLHGLPGKYSPASEADAIWTVVENTLATIHPRSAL